MSTALPILQVWTDASLDQSLIVEIVVSPFLLSVLLR